MSYLRKWFLFLLLFFTPFSSAYAVYEMRNYLFKDHPELLTAEEIQILNSGSSSENKLKIEDQLKSFCKKEGYEDLYSYSDQNFTCSKGKNEQVPTSGKASRALQEVFSTNCSVHLSPVAEIEKELNGKLFFVQTLPGMSEDGNLIATYDPKGIRIERVARHWERDETGPREVLNGDRLTTLHFSVNNHAPSNFYAKSPFVVIIPLNQPPEFDILKSTVSASFQEAVVMGDYKLPPNAIIMVRESALDKLPEYYKEKFKVITFDDTGENGEPDIGKKRAAVSKVLLEQKGLPVDLPDNAGWYALHVKDREGREVNTMEFFRKLIPHGPVAFGIDEFTHPSSEAEQWRMAYTRSNSVTYHGDVGFSIERYQSQKLNKWLKKFNFPKEAIENHKRVNRENMIAFRAMDYVFDHFKNKKMAYDYIETHLKKLEQKGLFKRIFVEEQFKGKSVDELARVICDYEYLKSQNSGIIASLKSLAGYGPKFDLVDKAGLIERLFTNSTGMPPDEAREFFNQFFSRSTIFASFAKKEQQQIRQIVMNMYVLSYANGYFVSEKMIDKYKSVLASMVDEGFKIRADNGLVGLVFMFINDNDILSKKEELQKLNAEGVLALLQEKFDKTVLYLRQ